MDETEFWAIIERSGGDEEALEDTEAALADPESLADVPGIDPDEVDAEGFGGAAAEAYEATHDEEMPDSGLGRPAEPAGEPWDEDDVDDLFPRLSARFG